MKKLHLVLPMAGRGSRFYKDGFPVPKPLIEIRERPFFYWAARSIEKFIPCADLTFVVLQEHVDGFGIDAEIRKFFPDAKLTVLSDVTEGAAVTALRGVEALPGGEPVLFNDCDHLFRSTEFERFCADDSAEADGALLTFESSCPAYSYLKYDASGCVCGTAEKVVVSRDAICGAYYFKDKETYQSACEAYLQNCAYQEFFLSGVYNAALAQSRRICGMPTDFHLPFGTPEEYRSAEQEENLPYFETLL